MRRALVLLVVLSCTPACVLSELTEEQCTDGIDNDRDGLFDCDDGSCAGDFCLGTANELCGNGLDDDGDGAADCLDADCLGDATCPQSEDCANGVDDDLDALTDCLDTDCAADPLCDFEDCDNGLDDDADGLLDCDDPVCAGDPLCGPAEDCTNALDDDGDGQADCADSDCGAHPACLPPEDCSNALDDDGDGQADCADSDCVADPGCDATGLAWTAQLDAVSTSFGEIYQFVPGPDGLFLIGVPNALHHVAVDGFGWPSEPAGWSVSADAATHIWRSGAILGSSTLVVGGSVDGAPARARWTPGAAPAAPELLTLTPPTSSVASGFVTGVATTPANFLATCGNVTLASGESRGFLAIESKGTPVVHFTGGTAGQLAAVAAFDGGFVAVGSTTPGAAGNSDALIVRVSGFGNLLGAVEVGGAGFDYLTSVVGYQTGFAATGRIDGQEWLALFDGSGVIQWQRTIALADHQVAVQQVLEDALGYLVVTGFVTDAGQTDPQVFALRLNDSGDLVSAHDYGGWSLETPGRVVPWQDGIALTSWRSGGDVWLAGTDSALSLGTCASSETGTWTTSTPTIAPTASSATASGTVAVGAGAASWSVATQPWTLTCPAM